MGEGGEAGAGEVEGGTGETGETEERTVRERERSMEENCDQRNMALLGQIFAMNVYVGCIVCVCATSISISPSPTSVRLGAMSRI